jgi:hypothetical protein
MTYCQQQCLPGSVSTTSRLEQAPFRSEATIRQSFGGDI